MVARALAIGHTFNRNEAISFAAYRALLDLFPGDKAAVFDPLMRVSDTIQQTPPAIV